MGAFTIIGLIFGLVFAFFLPVIMEAASDEIRNESGVQQRHRPISLASSKRKSSRASNVEVNQIDGNICWQSGLSKRDCPCRSCRS